MKAQWTRERARRGASPTRSETRRLPLAHAGEPRLLCAYPNTYAVGMANLGLHALLELALESGALVDRVFLPESARGPLRSLELGRPLREFDAILCSLSFEPDHVGLVQILERGGIEPLAERRGERAPLVIAGGVAASLNPEPIAPFCDLVGIGEAEALLPPILELLRGRPSRTDLIERAAALPGWYAPALGVGPVVRQALPVLERPCRPVALSPHAAFAAHVDLEISRGCRWRCRFCAAGQTITPYRELDAPALEEAIGWAVAERGRVGLVGTDVSDHGSLEAIARAVWDKGGELALPSLRVESLSRRESAASRLIRSRPPRTLTMAVEAACEGLRHGLGKRLSDEQVLRAARLAREVGVVQLRVYLLCAIPGEQPDEVAAIVELARELLAAGPPGTLALSLNGLVPKPGTPMQWEAAPDRRYLREVRATLRRGLAGLGAGGRLELSFESPDWTRWQALLSLGDREAHRFVLLAARDGWRASLGEAERESPILRGVSRWPDGALPWAAIDHGAPAALLREERRRFLAREYVPPTLLAR